MYVNTTINDSFLFILIVVATISLTVSEWQTGWVSEWLTEFAHLCLFVCLWMCSSLSPSFSLSVCQCVVMYLCLFWIALPRCVYFVCQCCSVISYINTPWKRKEYFFLFLVVVLSASVTLCTLPVHGCITHIAHASTHYPQLLTHIISMFS